MSLEREVGDEVYKVYGLEINPFSAGGSFPLGHAYEKKLALAFAGRDEAERIINQSLNRLSRGEGFPVIAICGFYGYGKTHALKYIYWTTRDKYYDILPIYIKGLDKPSGKELYVKVVTNLIDKLGHPWLLNAIKNMIKSIRNKPELEEQMRNIFPDMLRVLIKIKNNDILAFKWLLGNELKFEELVKLGIYKNIDESNASKALSAFAFFIYIGYEKKLLLNNP
mgnify:CR=1 FL=1